MSPRIYSSQLPDLQITSTSIFTRLFASRKVPHNAASGRDSPVDPDVGGYPGSTPAFVDAVTGATLTRAQLRDLALRFAHGIRTHPTSAPLAKVGSTVLIYAPNALAWPVILFGCFAAGLRCTLANSAYTARELAHQYTDSRAGLIVCTEDGLPTVREMFADELGVSKTDGDGRVILFGVRDLEWAGGPGAPPGAAFSGLLNFTQLLVSGKLEEEEKFEGDRVHETVLLCYSSGTTGKPKGVESTHENMTAILDIMRHCFPTLEPGKRTVLGMLPFYHLYGAFLLLHECFALGWTVLIQSQFEPSQFCAAIEKFQVSFVFIVPPVLVVLARHPVVDQYDLSSLEYMLSAAAPLGADLVRQVQKRLLAKRRSTPGKPTRCLITQGYGLTETNTGVTILLFDDAERKVGSVGPLLPNLEARIVQDEEGQVDAKEGEPGELWVRGKTIMKGYLGNPSATRNAITSDGWFNTGDIVVRDAEGYFYVVDRRKELIKYKGFQVPPAELEAVLLTHPDIADAAVIGVDSPEQATELPRAYVVHARPQTLTTPAAQRAFEASVATWIQSRVARHKYLRGGVKLVDAIPKSPAGKILRRELRELAKQERERGDIQLTRAKL